MHSAHIDGEQSSSSDEARLIFQDVHRQIATILVKLDTIEVGVEILKQERKEEHDSSLMFDPYIVHIMRRAISVWSLAV